MIILISLRYTQKAKNILPLGVAPCNHVRIVHVVSEPVKPSDFARSIDGDRLGPLTTGDIDGDDLSLHVAQKSVHGGMLSAVE